MPLCLGGLDGVTTRLSISILQEPLANGDMGTCGPRVGDGLWEELLVFMLLATL
jgi:hypothetical protein